MKRKRIEPWFLVFADFHGANIPTVADIKLPHEVTEQGVGKYCTQQVLTSKYEPASVYHYLAVNQPLYSVKLSSSLPGNSFGIYTTQGECQFFATKISLKHLISITI